MEARASAKYLRGSPQKARLVIDMIRGKNVNKALAILRYSNKRAALGIEKCVKSAIANANEAAEKANVSVDPDDLWLKAAYIDDGPTKHRRRLRPAPQGRAFRQQRHFCHVTILLSSDKPGEDGKKETVAPAMSKRARRGGAAAAPRAKRATKTEAAEAAPQVSETPEKKAKAGTKKAASGEKKAAGEKKASKAGSKLSQALRRKKKEE
ncbi:MAG TPA: 50S ribosomal protein L22 [Pyrinomonadaceae bacterium]|jgi:large subunit ribosomal protein L22